jgi:hypothetical protein
MFNQFRSTMYANYHTARNHFISNPTELIEMEKLVTELVTGTIETNLDEFKRDYDEASYLYPFWGNYPPENRGRSPVGDQIPWIEVGEHAVGHKLTRMLGKHFNIREIGLPTGADDRFVIQSDEIRKLNSLTDSIMLFMDVKSVGPRDDFEHIVVSPNQVSGDGLLSSPTYNVENTKMIAIGKKARHDFHPAVPPFFVLSDGTVTPVIHIFIKPIYSMLHQTSPTSKGQPLSRIRVVTVPNGLLLTQNPNYLNRYPGLLFPGKDDASVPYTRKRCRVSFEYLNQIDTWRNKTISI